MVEIAHLRDFVSSEQTTTSSTFSSTTCTIADTAFVATGKYLIIASGLIGGDDTNQLCEMRLVHASTVFKGSLSVEEPRVAASTGFFEDWGGFWIFDQPETRETITIQFRSTDDTTTARADLLSLIAIRLDDDLVENTDWWWAEDDDIASPVALSTGPFATKTITTTTDDDYLVLGHIQVDYASLSGSGTPLLRIAGTTYNKKSCEGEDTAEFESVLNVAYYTEPSGQSRVFDIHGTGSQDHAYSQVFVLKLNGVFADYAGVHNAGTVAGSTDYTELAGVAPVLATTQDVLLLAWSALDASAARYPRSRLQEGGADEITSGTNYQAQTHDNRDEHAFWLTDIQNITSGTKDFDFDSQLNGSSGSWQYRNLITLGLELFAAGAGSASPATIARSFALGATTQVGPAVDVQDVIGRSFTVDAAAAKGAAVDVQDVINRSFGVNAVTPRGAAVDVQDVINRVFALDPVTPVNSDGVLGTASPDVIALAFTIWTPSGFVVVVHVPGITGIDIDPSAVTVDLDGSTTNVDSDTSITGVDMARSSVSS